MYDVETGLSFDCEKQKIPKNGFDKKGRFHDEAFCEQKQNHSFSITDDVDPNCTASASLVLPDCNAQCSIEDISVTFPENKKHIILVEDFKFTPDSIQILVGDTVFFDWVGTVPHTATSSDTSGLDVYDSGLLGLGANFQHVFRSSGEHIFYCKPHGTPQGEGMAGVIVANSLCIDSSIIAQLGFSYQGTSDLGFSINVDGVEIEESPLAFDPSSSINTQISVPSDNETHVLEIIDLGNSSCTGQITFESMSCQDSCLASFNVIEENLEITFINTSSGTNQNTNVFWDFGDGTMQSNLDTVVHQFELGIFTVCLEIEGANCNSITCEAIDLSDPCLEMSPYFSYEINSPFEVLFSDESSGNPDSWLWGFGDGQTSTLQHPVHLYDSIGIYNVCLLIQDSNNNCTKSFCDSIDLNITTIARTDDYTSIRVFPNPSLENNEIWVDGFLDKDVGKMGRIVLNDISGRIVMQQAIKIEKRININPTLQSGLYFLMIQSHDQFYKAMVIIQ